MLYTFHFRTGLVLSAFADTLTQAAAALNITNAKLGDFYSIRSRNERLNKNG